MGSRWASGSGVECVSPAHAQGAAALEIEVEAGVALQEADAGDAVGGVEGAAVRVRSQDGGRFTYVPEARVESVQPASGPTRGGTQVSMYGHDYNAAGGMQFWVSGSPFKVHVVSSQEAASSTPPGRPGFAGLTLGGYSTGPTEEAAVFLYREPAQVRGAFPRAAWPGGGALVRVPGRGPGRGGPGDPPGVVGAGGVRDGRGGARQRGGAGDGGQLGGAGVGEPELAGRCVGRGARAGPGGGRHGAGAPGRGGRRLEGAALQRGGGGPGGRPLGGRPDGGVRGAGPRPRERGGGPGGERPAARARRGVHLCRGGRRGDRGRRGRFRRGCAGGGFGCEGACRGRGASCEGA